MTQVIRIGGSIGSKDMVVGEFEDHNAAKVEAKRLRSYLTPGERSYYGMTYKCKKLKE